MKIPVFYGAGLLSVLWLAGCAVTPPETQLAREMSGLTDQPPVFKTGYADGCRSGLSAAGNRTFDYAKDLSLLREEAYRVGWEDGFRVCQSRQAQRSLERNYDGFGYPYAYPWFPRTVLSIGVRL